MIKNEFEFYHHKFPDFIYQAVREGDAYIVEWVLDDGELMDNTVYDANDVVEYINEGFWIIVSR